MSSNGFAVTLDIEPRPSKALAVSLVGVHLLSAAVLPIWIAQWWFWILGWTALAVSLSLGMRRHLQRRGNGAVRRAVWQQRGGWRLLLDDHNEPVEAELLPDSLVTNLVVILNFRLKGGRGRRNMVICRDSVDATTFRRLRARLRLLVLREETAR